MLEVSSRTLGTERQPKRKHQPEHRPGWSWWRGPGQAVGSAAVLRHRRSRRRAWNHHSGEHDSTGALVWAVLVLVEFVTDQRLLGLLPIVRREPKRSEL